MVIIGQVTEAADAISKVSQGRSDTFVMLLIVTLAMGAVVYMMFLQLKQRDVRDSEREKHNLAQDEKRVESMLTIADATRQTSEAAKTTARAVEQVATSLQRIEKNQEAFFQLHEKTLEHLRKFEQ